MLYRICEKGPFDRYGPPIRSPLCYPRQAHQLATLDKESDCCYPRCMSLNTNRKEIPDIVRLVPEIETETVKEIARWLRSVGSTYWADRVKSKFGGKA